MRRTLVLALLALGLVLAIPATAQVYPPELAGGVAVVESQPVRLGLVDLVAPVGLPPFASPWWTVSATITADGAAATLTTTQSSHVYPWDPELAAYATVVAYDATHLRVEGLVYHGAGAWSWVTADLVFTGACCPWWEFDPDGWLIQFATVAERLPRLVD